MANRFTQKAQNTLNRALIYARELGHTYIGSEHILLGLLGEPDSVAAKLLEARGASFAQIRETVAEIAGIGTQSLVTPSDMTPRTKKIIEISSYQSLKNGQNYIGTEHILLALIEESDCVGARILESRGVSTSDLKNDIMTYLGSFEEIGSSDSVQTRNKAEKKNALSKVPTLAAHGRDLTSLAKNGKIDPIIGRESETERVIQILSRRSKNNPCLIGEPGVGKTAVVEGLAQKIVDGDVPEQIKGKTIVTLDIPSMIAGAKYRGEFEERMKNVLEEVSKNPNIILFIDEIHTIIGAGAAEGAVDAANIIKPALARGEMQLIGATTISEYRKHIEKDAALERRFQSVFVGEPSADEAVKILRGLRDKYEAHHKLKISDEAIEAAVSLSRRYITDRYLPDKAIDLIDEAASRLRITIHTSPADLKKIEERLNTLMHDKEEAIGAQNFEYAARLRDEEKKLREQYEEEKSNWEKSQSTDSLTVHAEDIADIVTQWTGIPVSKLLEGENEKLLNLEENLKELVIGQDSAVEAISKAIRRGRMGLKNPRRPIGSFIFLGQTGVGKTELTKALASLLFGDPSAMIRLDMSEYMERHSVSKLIGSPPGYVGYDEGGQLTEKIRRRPYSVVLFDEIEKAHPDVFNMLLQVLEDGVLTDSQGRKVDFKNTIIVMTSNVGATERVTRSLGFSNDSHADNDKKLSDSQAMNALKQTFRPEFLNRIDDIIIFNKLTKKDIKKIASIMLKEVRERIEELGVSVEFDESVYEILIREGFDPAYGARPLRRAIVRLIEDSFSSEMLEGKIRAGDTIIVCADNEKIKYLKKEIQPI